MWPFKTRYCYYKMVTQHFYGLCGVTIEYRKLKDDHSAIEQMFTDMRMEDMGFHLITKEEYEASTRSTT